MTLAELINDVDDFKIIGLEAFFNVENDKNIDWEDFFQLSDEKECCKIPFLLPICQKTTVFPSLYH